jgi:hypothetical protein
VPPRSTTQNPAGTHLDEEWVLADALYWLNEEAVQVQSPSGRLTFELLLKRLEGVVLLSSHARRGEEKRREGRGEGKRREGRGVTRPTSSVLRTGRFGNQARTLTQSSTQALTRSHAHDPSHNTTSTGQQPAKHTNRKKLVTYSQSLNDVERHGIVAHVARVGFQQFGCLGEEVPTTPT